MTTPPRRTALALLLLAVPLLAACEQRSPEETLWRANCAECHGLDGRGNTPRFMGNAYADLTDSSWRIGAGDEASIAAVVREGVFGQMPANSELTDDEIRQIYTWLAHLRGESPDA